MPKYNDSKSDRKTSFLGGANVPTFEMDKPRFPQFVLYRTVLVGPVGFVDLLLVDLDLTFCLDFFVCKLLCVLRSDSEDEEAATVAQWMSRFPISSLLLVTIQTKC
jgi:hypothetical protein